MTELRNESGFTLVELAITVLVLGILLAFSIPSLSALNQTQSLRGAAEDVAAQLRLARAKAIGTGVVQPVHMVGTKVYHIHYSTGIQPSAVWSLPTNVKWGRSMGDWYRMNSDGSCTFAGNADGVIPITNSRGAAETVTVQRSGLITVR